MKRSEAITNFLAARTHPDLAQLYSHSMEVQVSVAQDGGDRITGEFRGRAFAAFTDGFSEWKSYRIPISANTNPEDNDTEQNFDLDTRAEGIGMTGWDWENRKSVWVGFDFDALIGHADAHRGKLTDAELAEVQTRAVAIPWVTVRKSTSGRGLHLYVFLDNVPTANHTEHAALARAILGKMSAAAGYDFAAKVDAHGGILWQWHRKMRGTDGLTLLKRGEVLHDIPPDWRVNLEVVHGRRPKALPEEAKGDKLFEQITGQQSYVHLDDEHRRLVTWLEENRYAWSWHPDHHMLVTHTATLKKAHEALGLKGVFDTVATGRDPNDINAFAFPLPDGAWVVRRYGNPAELDHWTTDRVGYKMCYLNKVPTYQEACKLSNGGQQKNGAYQFQRLADAIKATKAMGVDIECPEGAGNRLSRVSVDGDNICIEFQKSDLDKTDEFPGWVLVRRQWQRVCRFTPQTATGTDDFGQVIRHVVTPQGENVGWLCLTDGQWRREPVDAVRAMLASLGVPSRQIQESVGHLVRRPWTLVKVPFGPEHMSGRLWNRHPPRLKYIPTQDLDNLNYPTWQKILDHLGENLDQGVAASEWCKEHGILRGADYLKCWIAAMFQYPTLPLPYLFLFSRQQNTGKSILGEALEQLIVDGVVRAKSALTSSGGFNGELESKVLCTVEEGDLKENKTAYNRIKEWVTSPTIQIHSKGRTPYQVPNTTHWIHTSNSQDGCPIEATDTRVVMIRVNPLPPEAIIPKGEILAKLDDEGPDFLAAVLSLEIPVSKDRFRVPVVTTEDKAVMVRRGANPLHLFIEEKTHPVPGAMIKLSEFYDRFLAFLDESDRGGWNKSRMSADMPTEYPKGRRPSDSQWCFGNISWTDGPPGRTLKLYGDMLR